ncbi:MAG: hypothetical protein OEY94_06515 [Alphaproteobacteria bacterium]|nr:hypothetical protein [Alphaproteobacteria bacterium]
MSKISYWIIFIGMIIGSGVGGVMFYIAWDHNPQMVFTMNPEDTVYIFLTWMALVSFPFTFIAIVLETAMRFRKKISK